MNRKGFTLIELLATLIVLILVMSIGAYSIINIIKASKNENEKLLKKNINDAASGYYMECKYQQTDKIKNICPTDWSNVSVKLGDLVTYGFLTGNCKDESGNFSVCNPSKNDEDISDCKIKITSNGGTVTVSKADTEEKCYASYSVTE